MGALFSVLHSLPHLAERVKTLGVAVAGALQSVGYLTDTEIVLPFCEPAESEPFEDFSDAVKALCAEGPTARYLSGGNSAISREPCSQISLISGLPQRNIWQSRTVQAKKQYIITVNQAKKKALCFRHRYDRYGPPGWIDPALMWLASENPSLHVISSPFPFLAPHIVISPSTRSEVDTFITWMNGLERQDNDSGNRLTVTRLPPIDGPLLVMENLESPCPAVAEPSVESMPARLRPDVSVLDVPLLDFDHEGASSCGSSNCCTNEEHDDLVLPSAALEGKVSQGDMLSTFWLEEDEDQLPELPETWWLKGSRLSHV